MQRTALAAIAPLYILLFSTSAAAHDYWLMPSHVVLPADASVDVSLFLGEALVAEEERAHQPDRAARFVHIDAAGEESLSAAAGAKPVLQSKPLKLGEREGSALAEWDHPIGRLPHDVRRGWSKSRWASPMSELGLEAKLDVEV